MDTVSPPAAAPEPETGTLRGAPGVGPPGLEVGVRIHLMGGESPGGDFHDVVRLNAVGGPDGPWAVIVGEVRGRGPDAAETAELACAIARDAVQHGSAPAAALRSLNERLLERSGVRGEELDPSFCTAIVASIEPVPGGAHVRLAVGGHPRPLVLRRDGRVEQVRSHGTLLGVLPDPFVTDQRLELGRGDALVLYTDGVTEEPGRSAGGHRRPFDQEALVAILARCTGFTADVLAERIETAARAHVEDAPRDDLAIVAIRVPESMGTATLVSADLPSDATAPGRARRIVTASLTGRGLDDLVEPAVLLTSEVVTNAVQHGGGHARIAVEHDHEGLRISVSDASTHLPHRLELGVDATSGRGIHLLDELADRWGVELHPGGGKTVWFELDVALR
jgi:anti-sigma regulatory factor (Ser/Thr protein kinase)